MKKLLKKINNSGKYYFSLQDLYKISNINKPSLKVAVNRAVRSGLLKKITKNIYTNKIENVNWENLAINLYKPSYISFEYALSYYNILSQRASDITLATTKRKKEVYTKERQIIYHHIKNELFWGYLKKGDILIAEPEKAFLDLAYLSLNGYANFDVEEMNINLLKTKKIKNYLKKINNKKLTDKIKPIINNK